MKKTLSILILALGILSIIAWFVYKILPDHRVAGVQTENQTAPQPIRGLILPHHDLAKESILQSINQLAQQQQYTRIVIIGPNHFHTQQGHYTANQITNFPIDQTLVKNLITVFPTIKDDPEVIAAEHSMTTVLPYLHNAFPQAQFIPVVLSGYFKHSELEQLANFFHQTLPTDTLYVASVDFAHNKMVTEGIQNNLISIETLTNFNYSRIATFNDEFTDSPPSIITLMKTMEQYKATNWQTWHNTHGALITNQPNLQGTSYVIGVYN